MAGTLRGLALALLFTAAVHASEVVTAARWELHSSFWMSLHQKLIGDLIREQPRDLSGLSPEELAAWNEAVAAYRKSAGDAFDPTFTRDMMSTSDALSQVDDDAKEPLIESPLAEVLKKAAPVYRKHWWAADDKANRFFIGYAAAMVRDAGEELVAAHEKVYRTPLPKRIRVYVTPDAGPFGAYTMSYLAGGPITTMSSRDPGYQGLSALEMLLHESSHLVAGPNSNTTLGKAIATAATKHNARQPGGLWHAVLFTTTSVLTKRLLAERGSPQFVPSMEGMFTRVWPNYRATIEKHWIPYLDGKGTLEEAVENMVVDVTPR